MICQKLETILPKGRICCNCTFCKNLYRAGIYICSLRRAASSFGRSPNRENEIGCIYTTSCQYFIDVKRNSLKDLLTTTELEEVEVFKSLGKFQDIPEDIIEMRRNFFLDQNDATEKQRKYSRELAITEDLCLPMKISLDKKVLNHCVEFEIVNDKRILRQWISEAIEIKNDKYNKITGCSNIFKSVML